MKTFLLTATFLGSLSAVLFAQENTEKPANKLPDNLAITITPPMAEPTLAEVNSGKYKLLLNLKNTGKTNIVLWPHITAELSDSQGNDVPQTMYIGRFGLGGGKLSILETFKFVTVAPGKTHSIPIMLNNYPDAVFMAGWTLKAAGEYKLHIRYQYDRAEIKKEWGEGAKNIEFPSAKWNQALEVDTTVTHTFKPITK